MHWYVAIVGLIPNWTEILKISSDSVCKSFCDFYFTNREIVPEETRELHEVNRTLEPTTKATIYSHSHLYRWYCIRKKGNEKIYNYIYQV